MASVLQLRSESRRFTLTVLGSSLDPLCSGVWGCWVRGLGVGTLGCSATVWAASALLAGLQNALAGAAGKAWCDAAGPILTNLLVPDRRRELLAGILKSSLDFAAKVDNQSWFQVSF